MNGTKRGLKNFHNFVIMRRSTRFLPENKRQDLRQLVGLIREHIKDVGMIVLFGSYAKDKYVDYDQRIEFGVPTYYMSDYDILILTDKEIGAVRYSLFSKIKDRFFEDKNRPFHTHPQFINYGIDDFNYALSKAHYFETEIKRDGIILYDSGEYKLARRRKLDFTEIKERAQNYFEDKFTQANDFLEDAFSNIGKDKFVHASFHLHQSVENFLRTISLVYILYSPKNHNLDELIRSCKAYTTELCKAFPRNTPEEERLFDLLQRSYIESRYNPDFEITKDDIRALVPKVELLKQIVEKVCRERFDYYDSRISEISE